MWGATGRAPVDLSIHTVDLFCMAYCLLAVSCTAAAALELALACLPPPDGSLTDLDLAGMWSCQGTMPNMFIIRRALCDTSACATWPFSPVNHERLARRERKYTHPLLNGLEPEWWLATEVILMRGNTHGFRGR